MRVIREKWQGIQGHIMVFMLAFCMVVGGYGIFTAPASKECSEQASLERELENNVRALQQMDLAGYEPDESSFQQDSSFGAGALSGKKQKNKYEPVSVIGDSVFLGAAVSFKKIYKNAVIDAKISRQVIQAIDVAKQMKKKGKLRDTVIIALGTNGTFTQATGQKLIDYLGKDRTIYWVSAYGKRLTWQGAVNKTIQRLVRKNKNVHIISWAKYAKNHPNWFYQDGIHLNSRGQMGFAKFIRDSISSRA